MHDANESNGLVASARFAEAMRDARTKKGWSQRKLAEELEAASGLKLDPSAMTRMENNQRDLKLDEAVAIARVLDIPIATVLNGKQEQLVRECMLWLGEWDEHISAGLRLASRVQAALDSGALQPSAAVGRKADSDGVSGFVEFVESIVVPETWRFTGGGQFDDLWVSPEHVRRTNP